MVYTPPESFCVEPQTAWPNAFALPSGLAGAGGRTELGAGETLRMTMQLSLRFESGPGRD